MAGRYCTEDTHAVPLTLASDDETIKLDYHTCVSAQYQILLITARFVLVAHSWELGLGVYTPET